MWTIRYALPGALIIAGVVCLFAVPDSARVEAWAGFTGAGLSVFLLNALFRFGARGDLEREREIEARDYFSEHGAWPDEEPPPASVAGTGGSRKWRLPEGAVMPEDEAEERPRS